MTRYQVDIIWLGLILVALNIIVNFSQVKSVLSGSAASAPNASSPSPNVLAPGQFPNQPTPPSAVI